MTTIDDIRTTLRTSDASFTDLTSAAEAARTLGTEAEIDLTKLNSTRPDVLLQGSDDDLAKLDDAIGVAARTVERAAALAEACAARAAEVKSAAAEAARAARYDAVAAAMAAVQANVEADYLAATALFHGILERFAKADLVVAAVNADLPEGRPPLPRADHFRSVAPVAATSQTSDVYWLWCGESGRPIDDQHRVKPRPNGTGWAGEWASQDKNGFPLHPGQVEVLVRRLPFRDVITTRARHFRNPGPFAAELAIPPLFGETTPGWHQIQNAQPRAVLDALKGCNKPLHSLAVDAPETRRQRIDGAEREPLMAQMLATDPKDVRAGKNDLSRVPTLA